MNRLPAGLAEDAAETTDSDWQSAVTTSIRGLAGEVEAIDLRSFEGAEPAAEIARLLVSVDDLAARATRVMAWVLSHSGDASDNPEDDEPNFGPEEVTSVRPIQLDSIAFVAQLELRQCRERLAIGSGLDPLSALSECDRVLRRIMRGLRALDEALSQRSGGAPLLDGSDVLAKALRVRGCYAELSARIHGLPTPNAANITKVLRLAGTSLAVLVGRDAYPELRVGDRLQLRALQFRILAWLKDDPRGASSTTEGLRLWSDILAFLAVLRQISCRPELKQHDARVLDRARAVLRDQQRLSHWPNALFEELRSLRGKSEQIDALLMSEAPTLVANWQPLLELHVEDSSPESA